MGISPNYVTVHRRPSISCLWHHSSSSGTFSERWHNTPICSFFSSDLFQFSLAFFFFLCIFPSALFFALSSRGFLFCSCARTCQAGHIVCSILILHISNFSSNICHAGGGRYMRASVHTPDMTHISVFRFL